MYMIVHERFYYEMLGSFSDDSFTTLRGLRWFNTIAPIHEGIRELLGKINTNELVEWAKRGAIKGDLQKEYKDNENDVPQWITDLYKVAMFMAHVGIAPHPNYCVDGHSEYGKIYEKMQVCSKKKT